MVDENVYYSELGINFESEFDKNPCEKEYLFSYNESLVINYKS